MAKKSLDLTKLLPKQYRDKTLDSLLKNLFNRHVSKADTEPLFGYIGDGELEVGEIAIDETDLERQINQITSLIYVEHATEKKAYSWPDLVQKLVLLGVNYDTIGRWFRSASYNFVPPIDIDKFCNFQEYFWIGEWVKKSPGLPYYVLGVPNGAVVNEAFGRSNTEYKPEYYTIERGPLHPVSKNPISPTGHLSGWTDWSLTNLWVHKQDAIDFADAHGGIVSQGDLVQANRPIIEYSSTLRVNTFQNIFGEPSEFGTQRQIAKIRPNQPPLFDLYSRDGTHTTYASAIFYYVEGSEFPVDPSLDRRVATDENSDFTFEHSLVSDTGDLMFFKMWNGNSWDLRTIWTKGSETGPKYVKYDNSGTIINHDKFTNYQNYYWIGAFEEKPEYNDTGAPEYTVIEPGGESDWSKYNHWVHVSQLKRSEMKLYIQAARPIIEFNKFLESELLTVKTNYGQLPSFKTYTYDDYLNKYIRVDNISSVDQYLSGSLFARLEDLGVEITHAIETTPELMNLTFEQGSDRYIQGFKFGRFLTVRDGHEYGYRADVITSLDPNKGTIEPLTASDNCITEVLTLTYASDTSSFKVVGTVSGAHTNAVPGINYSVSGVSFKIAQGNVQFEDGDVIGIHIKSYVFSQENRYVKIGTAFRSFATPTSIIEETTTFVKTESDPVARDGTWEVPPQLEWNVQNETRTKIKQGDLYYHLTSIIKAQPDLVGNEMGSNNFRNINKDLGLGGTIKQFDGETALLISMLLQDGVTVHSILDFGRQNYESLFNSIHTFIEDALPTLLADGKVIPPQAGDDIDPRMVTEFKNYFANNTPHKMALIDTTSPITGLAPTLPYLGLVPRVLPRKIRDLELNLDMLIHHDGHSSQLAKYDIDVLKRYVLKKFTRSHGQETGGIINAIDFPVEKPYRGQFWFQASTGQLFVYSVVSDTGEQPEDAPMGAYSYDRLTGAIYQFNGAWQQLGDYEVTSPWTEVKLDLIEQNIALAIEQELYSSCPDLSMKLDPSVFELTTDFTPSLKKEFERFGVIYGTPDVYSSAFNTDNAFTWNYRGLSPWATWNEIYLNTYGTPRPDIQPWIPAGYSDELSFINDLKVNGLVAGQTDAWDPIMWKSVGISSYLRAKYQANNGPYKLSVDLSTGNLLPPYSTNFESLFNTVPNTATDPFYFGANGPIELFWRKTLNYLYSVQKVYFKINPLNYLVNTWGIKRETVGDYLMNSSIGRKASSKDFQLHGDKLTSNEVVADAKIAPQASDVLFYIREKPTFKMNYEVKCISRLDDLFQIKVNGEITHTMTVTEIYEDDFISISIRPKLGHYYWGDTYTVTITDEGIIDSLDTSLHPILRVEGLNQLYVQYRRLYGEDLNLSLNQTLFKDWTIKAGYRFSGLINTDSLSIRNQDSIIDPSTYRVMVKENKFYNSSWINALRIQLVQKGSAQGYGPRMGPAGTPGEDWVFRVDNFNDSRTEISWYKFDATADYHTFHAMNGKLTLHPWRRYTKPAGVLTFQAPFLIRGLQNVVDFVFGYAQKMEDEGWVFNDQEDPVLDDNTGRQIGYQLLVEQFIDQQYRNVDAGSSFVFNPFSKKAWYKTPRGFVSNIFENIGLEQETVCTILDQAQRPLGKSDLRIFRQDDITEIIFDQPAYTLHLLTSEFEHVVLFEDYSLDKILMYDAFLGQRADKVFLSGDKQRVFTGRLDLGGHFLLGDKMKRNLEDSVASILSLYETTTVPAKLPETEYARALLGFSKKPYFQDRGSTDATEFRFWQGMISNKGTNFAINAYVNSSQYSTASLDEYWAYKIAEYGDARKIKKAELRIEPEDCRSEHTKFLLLERDELKLIKSYQTNGGFDVSNLGVTNYDVDTLYTDAVSIGYDYVDPRGCQIIRCDDEKRWYKYSDLRSVEYFEAAVIAEYRFVPDSMNKLYTIYDDKGRPVRADTFEIVDLNSIEHVHFYEAGDYTDSAPYDEFAYDELPYDMLDPMAPTPEVPTYDNPKFERLNHSTIRILDDTLIGRPLKVIAYGPDFSKFSPSALIDYRNNVTVKDDLIWWDPARGVHHPEAFKEVDIIAEADPARYNKSLLTGRNLAVQVNRPWGDEQVGQLWWNTENLVWQPYSDAKVIRDMNERLNRWGGISDASSMEIYEWFKSDVHPSEYESIIDTDGEIAIKNTLYRDRAWYHRPVAWRYSENPVVTKRTFLAHQVGRIRFTLPVIGPNQYGSKGKAVLEYGDFEELNVGRGCKIAGAVYGFGVGNTKIDSYLSDIFGTALITSDQEIVVGSLDNYTDGGSFVPAAWCHFRVVIDPRVLQFKEGFLGRWWLSHEKDEQTWYVRLTHDTTYETQRLPVVDVPILTETLLEYNFDQLGITVQCLSKVQRQNIPLTTPESRIAYCAETIGNLGHQIWLRAAVDVQIMVPFIHNNRINMQLDGNTDATNKGWIAWKDPEINPNKEFNPPLNRFEPFVGKWTDMGGILTDVAEDVKKRLQDPWTWFDGIDYNPYRYVWGEWKKHPTIVREVKYFLPDGNHDNFMKSKLAYEIPSDQFVKRVTIYVNEVQLRSNQWEPRPILGTAGVIVGTCAHIPMIEVQEGDVIRMKIIPAPISDEDMKFDPDVQDNIFKNTQYKVDYPHVYEEVRDGSDRLSTKNYYFWVKNRVLPGKNKRLPTSRVAHLLHQHDGMYEVPQVMKQYNQIDGRPNRYAVLSIRNLGMYVSQSNLYKLRITNNGTLRNDDRNLDLKNHHVEWVLLRPGQTGKIPKVLWDKLTDTMAGKSLRNQLLPFSPLQKYDDRNNTNDRYGFEDGQILADPNPTIATVKHTIIENKYVGIGDLRLDSQSLDEQLGKPEDIRAFMSKFWRFGKPRQINEIFFAVLEDAAAKNLELTDFFKTSFISIDEVRTIQNGN